MSTFHSLARYLSSDNMAKFAVLFIAAVAFQAVMADHQQQRRQVDDLVKRMKDMTKEVTDSIDKIQVDDNKGRRFMTFQANDFAHSVQNVVFKLQQTAEFNHDETKKTIKQVAGKLGETAFSIRQAMNSEPTQMKAQLKTQIQTVCDEVEKLKHIVDEQSQDEKRSTNDEIKKAISSLVAATKKVHTQVLFKSKSHQEVNAEMQAVATKMPTYVDAITTFDEQTAKDLAHYARHFAHMMYEMVDKLERQADKQEGEIKAHFHDIVKKMVEASAMLEKATNTDGNTQTKITEMKGKIVAATQILAAQVQKMMQVAQTKAQDEWMTAVVKCVMVDAVSAVKTMKARLEIVANKH